MIAPLSSRPVKAVLLDLDGVLRLFDPAYNAEIEERYSLPAGALAVAFRPDLLDPAVRGQTTHAEWMGQVASTLRRYTPEPRAVVDDWQSYHGDIDPDVLAIVREIRATGRPVLLVTNATDRLDADLKELGVADEVDAVVNSSRLGVAKPGLTIFEQAAGFARVTSRECVFVDDAQPNVDAAARLGMRAWLYAGPADLRRRLVEAGVLAA